jgi:hypothetical protein
MIHEPTRITIEAHGEKAMVEKPRSDIDVHELEKMLECVTRAAGWGVEEITIRLGHYKD